jgi:ribosomal protein L22
MTEKNYNPEQKHAKATNKMEKISKKEQKIAEVPKTEVKKEKTEIKTDTKKPEVKKIKKDKAIIRGLGIPISSKQAFAICKFIKYKEVGHAIKELEEILLHKKALPMKGEIPHRRGKGMMSGRYPKNALNEFVKLLKSLNSNANVNEISNPIISEAFANFASRPYGKFGRIRKKRTNVLIVATEKKIGGKK